MSLLQLEYVSKDFYDTRVLQDISFSLNEGEIMRLVGENGAGKTPLMHILCAMVHQEFALVPVLPRMRTSY